MALEPLRDLSRLREGARRFANGFTVGQKAVTIAAMVGVVIGAVVLMSVVGRPTYVPLFTNLSAQDAASITSNLSSQKVPYQLANGGSTILVPSNEVDKERIALAQAGLPASSTVGLSILDKVGITASNMTQQADYLRALQGELEQTIDSIGGVASSQVTIALAANQDFAVNSDTPTGASVMVTMKPGQTLTQGQVQAIVHLVGSSVPNLSSNEVTVADANGNLLAGPGVVTGMGGANSQTSAYDAAVQQKVQAYLAAVLGAGNADVQANATLDYNKVSTTTNSIVTGPNGQPVSFCTATTQNNQSYTGTGTPPGGAAGAITAPTGTGTGTYTNTQNTKTCEASQQTQTVQQAPGTVQNLQVAVLVNARAIPKGTNLAVLRAGVAAAAGITPRRGDVLAFSATPFTTAQAAQAAQAAKAAAAASRKSSLYALIRMGVVLLLVAGALLALWRSARKARVPASQVLTPADIAALRAARPLEEPTLEVPAVPRRELSPPNETVDLHRFIDSQPDDVAAMLRAWLNDPSPRGAS